MEQGGGAGGVSGAGGAGGTVLPGAEDSTAPAAPQAAQPHGEQAAPTEGTVTAAAGAQDGGKDEPGQEKAPADAMAQDRGQVEPGQEAAAGEAGGGKAALAPSAPEPRAGGKAALAEEASATQRDGGQVAPVEGKVPVAAEAQHGGKDEPGKEKAPAGGEPQGAAPTDGKVPAATEAQDRGKDESPKGQAPGGSGGVGKAEPAEEKAPAAAKAEGGKAKPAGETASAGARAGDGGKEEPPKEKTLAAGKEKVPVAAKAQDGGKKSTKAEKAPADKKPAKEKAGASVKAQDGENKVAKAEKAPAAKKAQDGGKEEPAKEKAAAPAKEKVPAAAKAQDGEKAAAKAEKTPTAKKPQDGGKEEPAKEKPAAPAKEKPAAPAKAQDGGKKAAKVEKPPVASKAQAEGKKEPAKDGGQQAAKVEPAPAAAEAGAGGEEPAEVTAAAKAQGEGEKAAKVEMGERQQPRGPEPPRPALLQSLSCPATCQRGEQPATVAMEMILEETAAAEPSEGPAEPGPAPPAPQERTVPGATGQPLEPGPGGSPPRPEAEPPPSPYLSPDAGKDDPFEILDDVPPPPAPFAHRIVTLRSANVSSQFNLSSQDILGGGKFGEVHTCTEKQTGLKLAAKVIRKQGAKDKEMVLLEIDVMNQLNHRNLIQLYDAIETPREIILFMEFVEGGELFERIIDDDYHLTEVDCMVFVRQICEGIRFMHHMRVLHLDLKPENILCVTATGHMVKIIDFGLARRYNPQEKLKVNFGTPEFLSPEVVNYEQVSYSTDMWSMGVITYMLLSGLSPFLGDNDTETLNNVLAANWYFDEETFESVSEEAKDFVSNLIIKEKSARMSAGQCLQHPWLNNLADKAKRCNRRLKSQVLLKKYVMRRRWKKNFIGVCAANRFKKITSSGSLTALGV
ncbi:myosin light chain kinase 2, skeletal/cardiac muscle [Nyctibius grandis]|uniref:myosin light chain kinase 2, skeletal/cardiac muscle n=1 Tax=Nyctibius grandis TaxID=48427 RepID=UPI0035BBF328